MPDPGVSDRERLLRLIDGGPEVARELQQQRETTPEPVRPAEEKKPAPAAPVVAPVAVSQRKVPAFSEKHRVRLAQAALAAIVVMFAVYSVTEMMKSRIAPASAAKLETPETLRLVGVDWGDVPVALLEDTGSGKTYFVRKNDQVRGARVLEIQKDHVSIFLNGKNLELR